MGEEPRSSPFRLYLLSALWSPSHGHTPPLYLYFVIPPLMLLITEESWDSPGPWQEPEEHKSDRILLDSHACSSRCSHCKPSPSCFCLKCAFRTHSPYPPAPASELPARIIAADSANPQCHPSDMRHIFPLSAHTWKKPLATRTLHTLFWSLRWRRHGKSGHRRTTKL